MPLGAPEPPKGQAELGVGAGFRQGLWCRAGLHPASKPGVGVGGGGWGACTLEGLSAAEVLRGPVSPGVLAENTGAASSTPWGQEVNRIFCVGVRTGSLLLPAPHSTGWAQVPKPPGLWRVPWAKPLREKGSGGGGFKLKSVPGFPARVIPNQDLDLSPYPNTQRSPTSYSYSGLCCGN